MTLTPGPTPVVLAKLLHPTAAEIETKTEPPYGHLDHTPIAGEMAPTSTRAAEAKGLAADGHLKADYAIVQNMYRAILVPYLAEQLHLAAYDERLATGDIPAATAALMPFAQYAQWRAGVPLNYLYIRNNLYVERLAPDEINAFLAHANDTAFQADPELEAIVTRTYPRVIRLIDSDGQFMTGFDVSPTQFYNDAVVVGMTVAVADDELNQNGRYTDTHRARETFVYDTVLPDLQQSLAECWPGHSIVLVSTVRLHKS